MKFDKLSLKTILHFRVKNDHLNFKVNIIKRSFVKNKKTILIFNNLEIHSLIFFRKSTEIVL